MCLYESEIMKVKHGKSISEIVSACVRVCVCACVRVCVRSCMRVCVLFVKRERRGKCVRKSRLQRERKGVRRMIRKGDRAER